MQTIQTFSARAAALFAGFVSAERVAAAVESGHQPNDQDLLALGIEPDAFARVLRA